MFKNEDIKNDEVVKSHKKTIIIAIIAIIAVLAVAGVTALSMSKKDEPEIGQNKTIKLYDELTKKGTYTFNTFLDDENKMYYSKKENVAYTDIVFEDEESKYVVKDGNTYLLDDEDKTYYSFNNNEMYLNKIEEELEEVKDLEYVAGKEIINNKEYKYEEYNVATDLMFKYFNDIRNKNAKTRFYYDGNKLVYIKTIVGDYEELLKVDMSYNVDSKLLEVPADYQEA